MRLVGGFGIGRWFGFEIRIDYSWFLIFLLVLWTLSAQVFPQELEGLTVSAYYLMGFAGAILLFLSVLLHELSHSAVARSRGIEVEGITLFIFGGVAQMSMEAERAIDEFLLTAAGPLSSLALAGIFYLGGIGVEALAWPEAVSVVAGYLAIINLALAVFNMVPGFPLDGGRIFRSVVWQITGDLARATRWATTGGRIFGYLLIGLGVVLLWWGDLVSGAWSIFIGWFLAGAAGASLRQFRLRRTLSGVPVERVMSRNPVALEAELPVRAAVEEYFLRHSRDAFPVVRDGTLVGVISLDEVAEVPEERRGETRVSEVMKGTAALPTASRGEMMDELFTRVSAGDEKRVLIMDGNRLVGMVTLDEIGGWVDRARKLGIRER